MRVSAERRRRAWIVGLVAVLVAAAWLAWANRAGRREAARLVAYHRDRSLLNRDHWLGGLEAARKAMEGGGRAGLEGLDAADRRLADATLSANRATYHARMAAFYEDALGSWGAGLPPIPEALEVDRRMISLQMHRRYAIEMEHGEMVEEVALYGAEPPRRLPAPVTGRP